MFTYLRNLTTSNSRGNYSALPTSPSATTHIRLVDLGSDIEAHQQDEFHSHPNSRSVSEVLTQIRDGLTPTPEAIQKIGSGAKTLAKTGFLLGLGGFLIMHGRRSFSCPAVSIPKDASAASVGKDGCPIYAVPAVNGSLSFISPSTSFLNPFFPSTKPLGSITSEHDILNTKGELVGFVKANGDSSQIFSKKHGPDYPMMTVSSDGRASSNSWREPNGHIHSLNTTDYQALAAKKKGKVSYADMKNLEFEEASDSKKPHVSPQQAGLAFHMGREQEAWV